MATCWHRDFCQPSRTWFWERRQCIKVFVLGGGRCEKGATVNEAVDVAVEVASLPSGDDDSLDASRGDCFCEGWLAAKACSFGICAAWCCCCLLRHRPSIFSGCGLRPRLAGRLPVAGAG